jgi:hypothetical protein
LRSTQVEGGKVVYDAFTTVKDNTGATINKDYVISELGQAGSSLASVSQGFSTRRDQEIEADDPGGLKLLAAVDTIDQLYTQFKSSIPAADGSDLVQSLTDLQDLATKRNNAVIAYNSALELLHQAITDEAYYTKQQQAYGNEAAKALNPGLPSILLWLRRTRDNYALEAMRLMNYANRAIFYWGLVQPADFASPGPLQDWQTLSIDKLSLDRSSEAAITAFAGSAPSHWPVSGRQGALYKLHFGQVLSLQNPLTSALTGDIYYSVTIKLAPGATGDSDGLPLFAGRANIRLDLVRLWLIGATVSADQTGARPISVVITQLGSEMMQNDRRVSFNFQHDAVAMLFEFDSEGVTSLADCNDSRVLNRQFLANYYVGQGSPQDSSIAAIGPWSTWTFEIRKSENKGLDMSGLTDAYIEFGGYCSPFKLSKMRNGTPADMIPVQSKQPNVITHGKRWNPPLPPLQPHSLPPSDGVSPPLRGVGNLVEMVGVPFQIPRPTTEGRSIFVNFLFDSKYFSKFNPDPTKGDVAQFMPLQAGNTKITLTWSKDWEPIMTKVYSITILAPP